MRIRSGSSRWTDRLAFPIASLAFFVLLAVMHTWPLATAPGRLSRNDTADTVHHEWILAWDAHQLAHDPRHLFDANIFYPEPDTLAYSDHLIVQGVIAAPLFWLGASPVLAYNLLLVAGLALTAWTTSVVMTRWTGSRMAGLFSGSLMAFNAMTLTRFAEIQDQHFEFFPLALWALDQLLSTPRVRYALQLAGWFVLQALTCGYLLAFTSLSLVAAVAVRPGEWIGARFRRVAGLLLLSASVAAGTAHAVFVAVPACQPPAGIHASVGRSGPLFSSTRGLPFNRRPHALQPVELSILRSRSALSRSHRVGLRDRGDRQRRGLARPARADGRRVRPHRLRVVVRSRLSRCTGPCRDSFPSWLVFEARRASANSFWPPWPSLPGLVLR